MVLGLILFGLATAWWYLFFEQMLGENVKQASECFYYTTKLCTAGNLVGSLTGFLSDIPVYSPQALWIAAATFIAGVVLYALGRPGRG